VLLEQAGSVLAEVQAVVDKSIASIRSNVVTDGKIDAKKFNRFQQQCFEIAVASAELQAARAMLAYDTAHSDGVEKPHPLLRDIAIRFCADTCKDILGRFAAGGSALGVARRDVAALLSREDINTWLDTTTEGSGGYGLAEYCCEFNFMRLPSILADEKEMVRETFMRFSDEVVAPLAENIHRQDTDIPEEIISKAAALGCFGTSIPERFGGLQPDDAPDSLGMIVVTEELSRGSLGAAGSLITRPEIAARALLAGGTEQQQQHWLPQLASGEKLCAISITEPDTGSDVAAVSLRATPTEGGWLLNGAKTWCTFAGRSEILVVLARTNPDAAIGYRGLSLFMVEKPAFPGHEFHHRQEAGGCLSGKAIATLGYRGMHSFQLFFDDYFVPTANLVGGEAGEGKGFYYTMAGFAGGRLQTAARATGVMQAAFEQAVRYAWDRKVFGQPIANFQLTERKLARMLATITAARQFSYAVAEKMDQAVANLQDSDTGQMEASLVKLFACRAAEWVCREAMQIHGGMGYAEESPVSRYFVDARVLSIFEGAEEVLAIRVIARELLLREAKE
jgi:(2S)-methylsuccinyl-CoA dehydrogenase